MNIRFHNLGKIKETELDLKPLTVIIGPNNSNKTYVAYSVYGLLSAIKNGIEIGSDLLEPVGDGSFKIVITTLVGFIQSEIKSASHFFAKNLSEYYQDSTGTQFANTAFDTMVSDAEICTMLSKIDGITGHVGRDGYKYQIHDDTLFIYRKQRTDVIREETGQYMNQVDTGEDASFLLSRILSHYLFYKPFLLPAERNAFVTTYKILSNRRFKLLLNAQRRSYISKSGATKNSGTVNNQVDPLDESGDVRYPRPIEDFLEFLSASEIQAGKAQQDTDQPAQEQPTVSDTDNSRASTFNSSADLVEREIQSGNTIKFRPSSPGGHEIVVDVGNGVTIDLYNASSSIKQLTPLLLYLRQRATSDDLLIIDEPEMNLHPESQAKLLEILTILVNQGVHVLLTTHSPYLLSHLNNLAISQPQNETERRASAESLYLKDPGSLLDMDQISAYEMKDDQLVSLKDPDYGIRWDTLSDVSADLQQKYFQVHE